MFYSNLYPVICSQCGRDLGCSVPEGAQVRCPNCNAWTTADTANKAAEKDNKRHPGRRRSNAQTM